jgi:hypothetical protein
LICTRQPHLNMSEQSEANMKAGDPKGFRRLKSSELVSLGDFVANEGRGFELWEGPGGFRADSFVKPIYRQDARRQAPKKPK